MDTVYSVLQLRNEAWTDIFIGYQKASKLLDELEKYNQQKQI